VKFRSEKEEYQKEQGLNGEEGEKLQKIEEENRDYKRKQKWIRKKRRLDNERRHMYRRKKE